MPSNNKGIIVILHDYLDIYNRGFLAFHFDYCLGPHILFPETFKGRDMTITPTKPSDQTHKNKPYNAKIIQYL